MEAGVGGRRGLAASSRAGPHAGVPMRTSANISPGPWRQARPQSLTQSPLHPPQPPAHRAAWRSTGSRAKMSGSPSGVPASHSLSPLTAAPSSPRGGGLAPATQSSNRDAMAGTPWASVPFSLLPWPWPLSAAATGRASREGPTICLRAKAGVHSRPHERRRGPRRRRRGRLARRRGGVRTVRGLPGGRGRVWVDGFGWLNRIRTCPTGRAFGRDLGGRRRAGRRGGARQRRCAGTAPPHSPALPPGP